MKLKRRWYILYLFVYLIGYVHDVTDEQVSRVCRITMIFAYHLRISLLFMPDWCEVTRYQKNYLHMAWEGDILKYQIYIMNTLVQMQQVDWTFLNSFFYRFNKIIHQQNFMSHNTNCDCVFLITCEMENSKIGRHI